jgi:hypothetical protein
MERYIGTKIIEAESMNLGQYNKYRGWTIPANENPEREGYLVKYPDGYESWSPKEAFEEAYRQTDNLNFGLALEALKKGLMAARTGWNGKGMFIFMRPAAELHVDFVAREIKSLPQSVKDYYLQDCIDDKGKPLTLSPDDVVKFTPYLCLKAADGTIVNGWLASQTDMLSDDWKIL